MRLIVYDCSGENYNERSIVCKLDKRLLHHTVKGKLEVDAIFLPEVSGHSEGRLNLMFKDKNESIPENERKFFIKVNAIQREQIRWMFGKNWIQQSNNIWDLLKIIWGFIGGWLAHHLYGG